MPVLRGAEYARNGQGPRDFRGERLELRPHVAVLGPTKLSQGALITHLRLGRHAGLCLRHGRLLHAGGDWFVQV